MVIRMPICPKCGSLLIPYRNGLKCSSEKCRYRAKSGKETQIKARINQKKPVKGKGISSRITGTLPKVKEECPKCKNKEAFTWSLQTRAADEPETTFFECTKCKHRWREYE